MAAGTISPVTVLRETRASFDKLRSALLRTRADMIQIMETMH
jgi:hypothetical protein